MTQPLKLRGWGATAGALRYRLAESTRTRPRYFRWPASLLADGRRSTAWSLAARRPGSGRRWRPQAPAGPDAPDARQGSAPASARARAGAETNSGRRRSWSDCLRSTLLLSGRGSIRAAFLDGSARQPKKLEVRLAP